jgi:hypothetical protein
MTRTDELIKGRKAFRKLIGDAIETMQKEYPRTKVIITDATENDSENGYEFMLSFKIEVIDL